MPVYGQQGAASEARAGQIDTKPTFFHIVADTGSRMYVEIVELKSVICDTVARKE
jgi:hypothetical protein